MISIDEKELEKAVNLLQGIPKGVETALRLAMNRALQEGRTAGTRAATKQYTAKAKEIRPTFKQHKATRSNLEAELISKGMNLALKLYEHKPKTDTTGNKRKPVRVSVRRDTGLKPLGRAFVHDGRVMQRLGASRLPVKQLYGPAVPTLLDNEEVVEIVQSTMAESVVKRLDHETKRILEGTEVR